MSGETNYIGKTVENIQEIAKSFGIKGGYKYTRGNIQGLIDLIEEKKVTLNSLLGYPNQVFPLEKANNMETSGDMDSIIGVIQDLKETTREMESNIKVLQEDVKKVNSSLAESNAIWKIAIKKAKNNAITMCNIAYKEIGKINEALLQENVAIKNKSMLSFIVSDVDTQEQTGSIGKRKSVGASRSSRGKRYGSNSIQTSIGK